MDETKNDNSSPSTSSDAANKFEAQKPWNINPNRAPDKETHKKLQETIDEWVQAIQKNVHELLKENGVEKFQIVFHHPGTKELVILNKGSLLENTIIAKEAYIAMKTQINKLTNINE